MHGKHNESVHRFIDMTADCVVWKKKHTIIPFYDQRKCDLQLNLKIRT